MEKGNDFFLGYGCDFQAFRCYDSSFCMCSELVFIHSFSSLPLNGVLTWSCVQTLFESIVSMCYCVDVV
jgi:hypothetical protein